MKATTTTFASTTLVAVLGCIYGGGCKLNPKYHENASDGGSGAVCGDGVIEAGEVCDDGNTIDGDGCNSTCTTAHCFVPVTHASIAAALADPQCNSGTIDVYSGTYYEHPTIASSVAILGVGKAPTTIDGQGSGSVVTVSSGTVVLDGLTIQNGKAAKGGGVSNQGSLTIKNSIIQSNTASDIFAQGGGIYNDGPFLILQDVHVTNNSALNNGMSTGSAGAGGAGIYSSMGTLTISGGSVDENSVTAMGIDGALGKGAGIDAESGDLQLTGTKVTANKITTRAANDGGATTTGNGGGVYFSGTSFSCSQTSISTNTVNTDGSANGGGINVASSITNVEATISQSTISGNQVYGLSTETGGGIHFYITDYQSIVGEIVDSTISGNMLSPAVGNQYVVGGGMHAEGTSFAYDSTVNVNSTTSADGLALSGPLGGDGTLTMVLANTIAAGGCTMSSIGAKVTSSGYNLGSLCGASPATGDLVNANANLGPLADNGGPTLTQALTAGSPAIDAANPSGCLDSSGTVLMQDQRGDPRVNNGRCDIGAYEK